MNTLPPNEPLDEQEREVARILRALPGGEPPPALDAAILRAAANAAASSKRPVRRALASAGALWGIGSAAAAVLALGVAWQLRYGVGDTAALRERAPSAHMVSDSAEDESVQVELPAQAANAPMSPPPAEAPLRRQLPSQPVAAAPTAAPAPAAAEPEPFAADREDDRNVASVAAEEQLAQQQEALRDKEKQSAAAAEGARAELEMKSRSDAEVAKSGYANAAPPPPPPAAYRPAAVGGGFLAAQSPPKAAAAGSAAPAASRAESGALDSVATTQAAKPESSKTEAAPAARKPATWLADIRKLRDEGKIVEARAALVEFHKKYPKWVIPTDLAPLLSQ